MKHRTYEYAEGLVEIPIESIIVGDRHRKNLGDIEELVASIERQGLLEPILVSDDHTLICGERRLVAHQMMGLSTILSRIVDVDPLKAEYDENVCRIPFSPSELYSIGMAMEAKGKEMFPSGGVTRDNVGDKLGMSGRTYDKLKTVFESADENDQFKHIAEKVDRGEMTISKAATVIASIRSEHPIGMDELSTEEREIASRIGLGETMICNQSKHSRLIGWAIQQGYYVKCDRGSDWGNPFVMGPDGDRDTVCDAYAKFYLPNKPSLLEKMSTLKGKLLGCWCKGLDDTRCHCDELKRRADKCQ